MVRRIIEILAASAVLTLAACGTTTQISTPFSYTGTWLWSGAHDASASLEIVNESDGTYSATLVLDTYAASGTLEFRDGERDEDGIDFIPADENDSHLLVWPSGVTAGTLDMQATLNGKDLNLEFTRP